MVQSARKANGLDVSDRINLSFSCDSELVCTAIAEHSSYIKEQVLALVLTQGSINQDIAAEELGDSSIRFEVKKA